MKKIILLLSLVLMSMTVSAQSDSLDAKYGKNLLKAGSKAPDFKLLTADKKEICLSDYSGSYVVLDFWASWCPDCRKDIPVYLIDPKEVATPRDYDVTVIKDIASKGMERLLQILPRP